MTPSCAIIIVTYNSEKHIPKAIECVQKQTVAPAKTILVDTGSRDHRYLTPYSLHPGIEVVWAEKESGFCRGNNIGMTKVPPSTDYVFFLNPDAFLTPDFLEKAMAYMEDPRNQKCAALTGTVLGYDIDKGSPNGKVDTTGIFRTWYGKWYDRDQGRAHQKEFYQTPETIPAICGAVLFCRKKALDSVLIRGSEVLDNTFYMYKEDIDLSLRLKKKGWGLHFVPDLVAYHCRGWQADRSKMPRRMRLASARNDCRVQLKAFSPVALAYSLLKYGAVKFLDM